MPKRSIAKTPDLADAVHAKMPNIEERSFWACVWAFQGSITRLIALDVAIFGALATVWLRIYQSFDWLELRVGPVEIAGGALGLMLVFRTNASYDRWYEARRLWGGIVAASRNLVEAGLEYGPQDADWRQAWVRWCICFSHVTRKSLRGERDLTDVARLWDPKTADEISRAEHMPTFVAQRIARLLKVYAKDADAIQPVLVNIENARQQLIECVGGCERIASTPLPRVYVFKMRRFMAIYLTLLPMALVEKVGWAAPLLTMVVAYPVLGLDRIAEELQAPFSIKRLSHLPLDLLCASIEHNALASLRHAQKR